MTCALPFLFAWLGLPYRPEVLNGWGYVAMVGFVVWLGWLGWRTGSRRVLVMSLALGVLSAGALFLIFRFLLCCCV